MDKFMSLALSEALIAGKCGEVPVGAVIVRGDDVIASAHNLKESTCDPTAHAEILAIREACKKLSDWRLDGCDIYVTLEPCRMCSAAIAEARIRRVYFGAYDKDLCAELIGNTCEVYGGIDQTRCENVLKEFFKKQR